MEHFLKSKTANKKRQRSDLLELVETPRKGTEDWNSSLSTSKLSRHSDLKKRRPCNSASYKTPLFRLRDGVNLFLVELRVDVARLLESRVGRCPDQWRSASALCPALLQCSGGYTGNKHTHWLPLPAYEIDHHRRHSTGSRTPKVLLLELRSFCTSLLERNTEPREKEQVDQTTSLGRFLKAALLLGLNHFFLPVHALPLPVFFSMLHLLASAGSP